MPNPEYPHAEIDKDAGECRQLAAIIFDNPDVGEQIDTTYVPLKFYDPNAFSNYFLRFVAGYSDGTGMGSIEVVERLVVNGHDNLMMQCSVSENGDFVFEPTRDELNDLSRFDWPYVFSAPQIERCLHNFRNPRDDREIEPETLLTELMYPRDTGRAKPHIRVKEVKNLEIQEFEIDFLHRVHAMPRELANSMNTNLSSGELLKMSVRYKGKDYLQETIAFNGKGEIIGIGRQAKKDFAKYIKLPAELKGYLFNQPAD